MNIIYRVNQPFLLSQGKRKLLLLTLPELKVVDKYYTSGKVMEVARGQVMVGEGSFISILRVEVPPLRLVEVVREFLDWHPMGGFTLDNGFILYDQHMISMYTGSPLSQKWTIDVLQTIHTIKCSRSQQYIGMMVKQKSNIIYVWNLGQISTKTSQQIEVWQEIVKWEFHDDDILTLMTKNQIRMYCLRDGKFCLYYFFQLECQALYYCFLDRPSVPNHPSRRTVYPVIVMGKDHVAYFYQLYDVEKRTTRSEATINTILPLANNTHHIVGGFELNNCMVLVGVGLQDKPITYVINEQYTITQKYLYNPTLSPQVLNIHYHGSIIACEVMSQEWKIFKLTGKQEYTYIKQIECKDVCVGMNKLFAFGDGELEVHYGQNFVEVLRVEGKCPPYLYLLEEYQTMIEYYAYFIHGIRVYKYSHAQKTLKASNLLIRNDRCKVQEVNPHTRSILYRMGDEYLLMGYRLEEGKILAQTIRSTKEKVISLRKGRWAEASLMSITVGEGKRKLVEFDVQKMVKNLTQDNLLLPFEIYWTTHDGIVLSIKNYIFVLQLIESSEGYSLSLIKKMLSYLHHRLDPDAKIIQLLDPREFVLREDNRVIRLGSNLNYYVSEDPYSLPDTLLNRQLAMRKYRPPHHPKIITYLFQLGSFSLLSLLFKHIQEWLDGNGKLQHLYKRIGTDFYISYQMEADQKLVSTEGEDIGQLKKLCEKILQQPHKLFLEENGALILESQIQSIIFKEENSRSMDYFSSIVLMQQRLHSKKNKPFKTLQIAYLLHSINKQQAIGFLKPEKMEWGWMQKFSILFWYDSKAQIKKWVEQIGANEFRKDKEPFDCLFWYSLIGKKNLLITLFKSAQYSSKQHTAIFSFLQRDFTQPKDQSAAVKNAYVLIDKKRYLHALAFFIYGNKIEQAISLCLNKIKCLNLAMLIAVLCDSLKEKVLNALENDGDIWAKHISYYHRGKFIDSFNCLFEDIYPQNWDYNLKLSGFRPCAKPFAEMIEKSIEVKRELEQQKQKQLLAQHQQTDIFDSFFSKPTMVEQRMQEMKEQEPMKELLPLYPTLEKNTIQFYLKNNCPLLALIIDGNSKRAKRAYELEQYMLTQKLKPEVVELAEEMQDIISILTTKLQNQEEGTKTILKNYLDRMKKAISGLSLDEIVKKNKATIGQLLHLCYYGNKILQLKQNFQTKEETELLQLEFPILILISLILLDLQLQNYEYLGEALDNLLTFLNTLNLHEKNISSTEHWSSLISHYGKLLSNEQQKNKNEKQLDVFEWSLYRYNYKRQYDQKFYMNDSCKLALDQYGAALRLNEEIVSMVRMVVVERQYCDRGVFESLQLLSDKLQGRIKRWLEPDALMELNRQLYIMYQEGSVSKLKINYISELLQYNFQTICAGVCKLRSQVAKLNQQQPNYLQLSQWRRKQKVEVPIEGIEVFRNKHDGLKGFTINKNEGEGMQLVVIMKKTVKKLQVCESLVNRNRTHDGYHMAHEDTLYNMSSMIDFDNIMQKRHPPLIHYAVTNILENRQQYEGKGLIRSLAKRADPEYMTHLDPLPMLDYNQLHSIQCHHFLPAFLLGSKGVIEICNFSTLKNYNRIRCQGMSEIIKIESQNQRVIGMDNNGSLGCFSFDAKISGNCLFSLKKASIIDFCMMTPTLYGVLTPNSVQIYDTLLPPKRQNVFKVQLGNNPTFLTSPSPSKMMVGRKHELLFYDVRMDIQEEVRDVEGKIRSLQAINEGKVLVGRADGRVRVVNTWDKAKDYDIRCTRAADDKQKNSVEHIQVMGRCALAMSSEGSIFYFDGI